MFPTKSGFQGICHQNNELIALPELWIFLHYSNMLQLSSANASIQAAINILCCMQNPASSTPCPPWRGQEIGGHTQNHQNFNPSVPNSSHRNSDFSWTLPAHPAPVTTIPPNLPETLTPPPESIPQKHTRVYVHTTDTLSHRPESI